MPAKIAELNGLVSLSRQLNTVTGSTYYTPDILLNMPIDELDNLIMVSECQWQT
ncbi:MAG: hypothetical protein ACYTEW_26845 [Planctomycetota bacterium]